MLNSSGKRKTQNLKNLLIAKWLIMVNSQGKRIFGFELSFIYCSSHLMYFLTIQRGENK